MRALGRDLLSRSLGAVPRDRHGEPWIRRGDEIQVPSEGGEPFADCLPRCAERRRAVSRHDPFTRVRRPLDNVVLRGVRGRGGGVARGSGRLRLGSVSGPQLPFPAQPGKRRSVPPLVPLRPAIPGGVHSNLWVRP